MELIAYFLIVAVAILAHELGHFTMARMLQIPVTSFSLGFGPTILKRDWKGTIWQLKVFPLGGSNEIDQEAFEKASPQKRIAVFAAGATVNILVAIIALILMLLLNHNFSISAVLAKIGKDLSFVITSLLPSIVDSLRSTHSGLEETSATVATIFTGYSGRQLLTAILKITYSINLILGIGNLFPIPALDGGQILLTVPECFEKKIPEVVSYSLNKICLITILCIMGFSLTKDVLLMIF